jgi:hypothetical protein
LVDDRGSHQKVFDRVVAELFHGVCGMVNDSVQGICKRKNVTL